MKRWVGLIFLLSLIIGAASAQTTTVSGTMVDSDGTTWANGTYQIQFQPTPQNPNPAEYRNNGATFTQSFSGALDGSGTFSVALTQNIAIQPSGSQWKLVLCPDASAICGTFIFTASGSTMSLSSALTASIKPPRFPGLQGSYGYADAEVQITIPKGAMYFNVTSQTQRCYISNAWTNCGGGGGTYPAANSYGLSSGSAWITSHLTDNGTNISASEPISVTSGSGQGGTFDATEGTTATATAGHDILYADSTAHCLEYSANGGAFSCLGGGSSGAIIQNPTATATNTIAPTSTSVVPLTVNAPASTTVDIFDVELNGSKLFYLNQYGNPTFANVLDLPSVENSGGNLTLNAYPNGTSSSIDSYEGWGGSVLAAGTVVAVGTGGTHQVAACAISCTNAIGVVDSNPSSNNLVTTTGTETVTFDGSYTITPGENVCTSATTAGKGTPSSSACPTGTQIGYVTAAATTVTSGTVYLSFRR